MESILLSVNPKYCELTANGKKTIEIRKTRPKLDTPFKCFIYCTKSRKGFVHNGIGETLDDLYRMPDGEIKYGYSGELMCCDKPYDANNFLNGKVIGEFVCDRVDEITASVEYYADFYDIDDDTLSATCLTRKELHEYGKGENLHGWHITNLKIYDKPKVLSDFDAPCPNSPQKTIGRCEACRYSINDDTVFGEVSVGCDSHICRPPQSWRYVIVPRRNTTITSLIDLP